jgi:hypothetical protein
VAVVKLISFAKWLKGEKTRILSRRFFKTGSRLLISLFNTTALLFFASFAVLLIFGFDWVLLIPLFGLRLISQYVIFGLAAKKLDEKKLLLFSPLFEILLVIIDFFIWIGLMFGKKNKWK